VPVVHPDLRTRLCPHFPYTTLFRSHLEKNCPTATNASAFGDITGLTGQPFTSASFTLASTTQCQGGSPRFNIGATSTTGPHTYLDRKSTRLNSSHVSISYAVFCLKK